MQTKPIRLYKIPKGCRRLIYLVISTNGTDSFCGTIQKSIGRRKEPFQQQQQQHQKQVINKQFAGRVKFTATKIDSREESYVESVRVQAICICFYTYDPRQIFQLLILNWMDAMHPRIRLYHRALGDIKPHDTQPYIQKDGVVMYHVRPCCLTKA